VLEADGRIFHLETIDLSARGAKVGLLEPLAEGTPVRLHFHPEDELDIHVEAIAWRSDPDGMAFFFIGPSSPLWAESPWVELEVMAMAG
jgi:PilZ domain